MLNPHRILCRRIEGTCRVDLPRFREVWPIVQVVAGDDVDFAVMVEVCSSGRPVVIERCNSLNAEAITNLLLWLHSHCDIFIRHSLEVDLASLPHIKSYLA